VRGKKERKKERKKEKILILLGIEPHLSSF
jgi:hypothetical protein